MDSRVKRRLPRRAPAGKRFLKWRVVRTSKGKRTRKAIYVWRSFADFAARPKYRRKWARALRVQKKLRPRHALRTWAVVRRELLRGRQGKASIASAKRVFRMFRDRWERTDKPGVWVDRFTGRVKNSLELRKAWNRARWSRQVATIMLRKKGWSKKRATAWLKRMFRLRCPRWVRRVYGY